MTSLQQRPNPAISAFSIDPPLSLSSIPTSHSLPEPKQQKRGLRLADFRKLKELGKGKFGTVWLAMHKPTNFIVALKAIKKSTIIEQNVLTQLPKQLRIHNALTTKHVIAFYGFFFQADHLYIVGQYATDGHLFQLIKQRHRLEQPQVRKYAKETAEGISAIHKRGYIHRDIKPENILLQFGQVKIADLGWATEYFQYSDVSMNAKLKQSTVGTPLYYSPEMVNKKGHNEKVDVWALGLLVYELMVGKVPFSVWSEFDLHKIVEAEVVMPDYIDGSEALSDFVGRCLAKDQQKRATLSELLEHEFLKGGEGGPMKWELYMAGQKVLGAVV